MRTIRIYFSVGFLIFGLFVSANAQKLFYGGKPKSASKTANLQSYYVSLPKEISVYKVQNDTDEDREIYFEIRSGTKNLGKINASINAFGSQLDNFHAFYGDLDKNKSPELVIVDFDGQSNGLGVNYYTISVFPDFETKGFTAKPLTFNTTEFGKDGTFFYDAKANETLILLTEWGGVQIKSNSKNVRDGMYFTGRFFRYKEGKLKPAADKPLLARRYLNSFVKERFRTDNSPLRPYNWLTSPTAIKLKGDPVFDEKPLATESGVIEKFEKITEKTKSENGKGREVSFSQIVVRLDSGARKNVVILKDNYYSDLEESPNRIDAETLGILPVKMTLPSEFNPLIVFDKLEGKKVQINAFPGDLEGEPYYKVWFIE